MFCGKQSAVDRAREKLISLDLPFIDNNCNNYERARLSGRWNFLEVSIYYRVLYTKDAIKCRNRGFRLCDLPRIRLDTIRTYARTLITMCAYANVVRKLVVDVRHKYAYIRYTCTMNRSDTVVASGLVRCSKDIRIVLRIRIFYY